MANALEQQRLDLAREESTRRKLDNFARTIGQSDGSDKETLRAWLRGIDHAHDRTGGNNALTLDMVGYLVKGALIDVVTGTIAAVPAGQNATWAGVRTAIVQHCLGEEEAELLREKVLDMKQLPFESVREYTNRFTSAVARAYDANHIGQSMLIATLKRTVIKGLRSKQLRSIILLQPRATFHDVCTAANTGAVALGLNDEDMELEQAAMALPPPPPVDDTPKWSDVTAAMVAMQKSLQKEVQSMSSSIKALKLQTAGPVVAATQERLPERETSQRMQSPGYGMPPQPWYPWGAYPPPHASYGQDARTVWGNGGPPVYQAPAGQAVHQQPQQVFHVYGAASGRGRGGGADRGGRGGGRGRSNSIPYGTSKCYRCGEIGHFQRECPMKEPNYPAADTVQAAVDVVTQAAMGSSSFYSAGHLN